PLPLRDEAAERRLARAAAAELELPVGSELVLRDDEALAAAARLRAFAGEVDGDAHERLVPAPPLVARIDARGERPAVWFEVEGAAQAGAGAAGGPGAPGAARADAADVLRAWAEGRRTVATGDGALAPLPADWLARHGRELLALLESRDREGRIPAAALPDLGRLCDAVGAARPPALEGLRALVDGFDALPRAAAPPDLRAQLRPYQQDGV